MSPPAETPSTNQQPANQSSTNQETSSKDKAEKEDKKDGASAPATEQKKEKENKTETQEKTEDKKEQEKEGNVVSQPADSKTPRTPAPPSSSPAPDTLTVHTQYTALTAFTRAHRRSSSLVLSVSESVADISLAGLCSEKHPLVYPTLGRTLGLLSELYSAVEVSWNTSGLESGSVGARKIKNRELLN